jgi:hypothetical protein
MLVRVRATSVHADVWHVMPGVPHVPSGLWRLGGARRKTSFRARTWQAMSSRSAQE